jgi:glutamyl-Q tRNA(Asp) synthetase
VSNYRGRFAPSPTGRLHFGSLVAAVASFARARQSDGIWLVRMDDLDPPRELAGAAERILADLPYFGLDADEPVLFQSQRQPAYDLAITKLFELQLAFDCGCGRAQLPKGKPYPGTCEKGLDADRPARSVRLRVNPQPIEFQDLIQSTVSESLENTSGAFVVRRADGLTAYQLAVVVDDAWQGITEVFRGSDLIDSTPRQIHLQRCLGLNQPAYAHFPVATHADGNKLSKQTQALPIDRDDALPALLLAWQFLGQHAPPKRARQSVSRFWDWAVPDWDMNQVPRRRSICIE